MAEIPLQSSPEEPPPWLARLFQPILDRLDQLVSAMGRISTASDQPSTIKLWLNAEELAQALGVCARSIATWQHTGELPPPVKIGRCKKWNIEEVKKFLQRKGR